MNNIGNKKTCVKRKATVFFLGVFIILSGFFVVFTSVTADTELGENLLKVQTARDNGLSWLRSSQIEDGSWSYDLGITSLCVLAFLNAGYDESDTTVSKAIDYILQYVQADGSISSGTYANYYTSTALLALSAAHNSDYETIIKDATQFLIDIQIDENTPDDAYRVTKDDWRYGGIGYGGDGRPDLSNTQFALMALRAAQNSVSSLTIPNEVWVNSMVFIDRCHNNVDYNDQDWADNTSRPSYNDGGYIYFPTDQGSLAGGTGSYMSMTGAGIWSAILCGILPTDLRMQSALKWFSDRYTWEENIGFEYKALYYSYWSMARALTVAQIKEIITTDGISHDWFNELSDKLISLQTEEGYWSNTESDWFWENIPEVATSYAILALETNLLSSSSEIEITLQTGIKSGAEVIVYNSDNEEVGEKSDDSQSIVISDAQADTLRIEVVGKKKSDYTLKIVGSDGDREVAEKTYTGDVVNGEHQESTLVVTAVDGPVSFFGQNQLIVSVEGQTAASSTSSTFILAAIMVAVFVIICITLFVGVRRKKGA
jgi:squalene-hopene/tetraprenyl-beta-curcumene cyclase